MASALENGIRRRFNLMKRLMKKEHLSASDAAKLWKANKGLAKADRDIRLQMQAVRKGVRTAGSGKTKRSGQGAMAAMLAHLGKGARANGRRRARRNSFSAKQQARWFKSGHKSKSAWTKASRPSFKRPKLGFGGQYVGSWGKSDKALTRALVREMSIGHGGYRRGFAKKLLSSHAAQKAWKYSRRGRKAGKKARRGKHRAKAARPGWGVATSISKRAAANPLGALAFTNPGSALVRSNRGRRGRRNPSMGAVQFFTGYALPVTVAGAAAGGLHAFASNSGLTDQLTSVVSMVPVVGPMVADNAPFTLQGLVAGSGLALAGGMIGGTAGKYLALVGGAALVLGGGIDAFNFMMGGGSDDADDADIEADLDESLSTVDESAEPVGDLAFTNVSALGDLAFTNVSALGDLAFTNGDNLGDGMAYETAPLTAGDYGAVDYGQASGLDAQYSGADFAPREGQALCNGRDAFINTYGAPPRRAVNIARTASHLAGREGHRWGWLVKLIGWQRAQRVAAMPPAKRVVMIAKLRRGAIEAFQRASLHHAENLAERASGASPVPAAGAVANGALGAAGPSSPNLGDSGTNYLGEPALFMGA